MLKKLLNEETHAVPPRMGLRAVFLLTAICATIFGVSQAIRAELRIVAPVLSFMLCVGLAQMVFGRVPRLASALVGGVVFPLSAWIDPFFDGRLRLQTVAPIDLFWLVVCGLLAGYSGGALLAGAFLVSSYWQRQRTGKSYAMPRKFGIGTILLATTLFAILFAILEYARFRPWELFFFASFVFTVAICQATFDRAPRGASVLAGAFFLPLSFVLFEFVFRRWSMRMLRIEEAHDLGPMLLQLILVGACLGYLGGTLVAGVFLVSDQFLRAFTARRATKPVAPQREDPESPVGTLTLLAERAVAARRECT